jgi:hypothetical protein
MDGNDAIHKRGKIKMNKRLQEIYDIEKRLKMRIQERIKTIEELRDEENQSKYDEEVNAVLQYWVDDSINYTAHDDENY